MANVTPWVKKAKSAETTPAAPPSGPSVVPADAAPAKPVVTPEQALALFEAWAVASDRVERAKELAKAEESKAIKAILEALGKGPFGFRGQELTPIARKERNGAGVCYVMRAPKKRKMLKIG